MKSSLRLQIVAEMSSSDLRARMDGLEGLSKADAVYPEPLSRHNRSPIVAQQVMNFSIQMGLKGQTRAGQKG